MTDTPTEQDKTLAASKPKALAVMANRLNVEPLKLLQTLKDTVFKGASESELLALVVIANEYGLSPLLKEIYAFPAKGGGITPVVSIDGWISMVNRQAQLDGLEFEWQGGELPESCTCTIYIKNRTHPVRVTEFYKECFRATDPWKQMPRRMLRHKALKEAARVAFGFSGITDEDEARDIKPANAYPVPRTVEKPVFTPPASEPGPGLKSENLGNFPFAQKILEEREAAATADKIWTAATAATAAKSGTQSDPPPPDPAPVSPAMPSKPESKGKTAARKADSPQNRLFGALTQERINQTTFVEDLKVIKFAGVAADAELVHELSDESCEAILNRGLSQILEDIADAKLWEDVKK